MGIRPENFEDAALVPAENRYNGITFPATIDVVESLGSEKFVYFSKELGAVETAELAELARDSGRADTGAARQTVVARSTRRPRSPKGRTPSCGWTSGCTCSTRTGGNLTGVSGGAA